MRLNGHSGETSVQHMYQKIAIIKSLMKAMRPFRSDTILLVVANPVDLLTSFVHELSGLPTSQVLGSGTFLDSVRIRGLLAEKTEVRIHGTYILVKAQLTLILGRDQLDRSLHSGRAWGFTGCGMVGCYNRRYPS